MDAMFFCKLMNNIWCILFLFCICLLLCIFCIVLNLAHFNCFFNFSYLKICCNVIVHHTIWEFDAATFHYMYMYVYVTNKTF